MPGRNFFKKISNIGRNTCPAYTDTCSLQAKNKKTASVSKRKWSYQPPFLSVDTTIYFLYQYVRILKA